MSHCFDFLKITQFVAAIGRQFRTSAVHAFTHTNVSELFVLGTFTSMPEHPSLSKIVLSLIWPILLPRFVLRSTRPLIKLVGLSNSSQRVQSFPVLFLAGLVA